MARASLVAFASVLLLSAPAFAQEAPPLGYLAPPQPTRFDELPPGALAEAPPPAPISQKNRKGFVLALDFSAAAPPGKEYTTTAGGSLDLRAGYRFALGPIFLSPELTLGGVYYPNFDGAGRIGAGGHVGLDLGLVEPSVYAYGGGFKAVFVSGWGVRTGAALDFRVLKFLSPGIHVDYNAAGWPRDDNTSVKGGVLQYVAAGAHLGFVL